MWTLLIQALSPRFLMRDGVGLNAKFDAAALADRYKNMKATCAAVTEYHHQQEKGTVKDSDKTDTARKLDAFATGTDLTRDEVRTVREIRDKVQRGERLTPGDMDKLRNAVERLQAKILGEEKAKVGASNTSTADLQQLATDGITTEINTAATDALVERAMISTDPAELAELIKPAGKEGVALDNVLEAVAGNPNTPPEVLARILDQSHSDRTELALASNPNSATETLKKLAAKGLTAEIKATAAKVIQARTSTDPADLEKLAADVGNPAIRTALAANPSSPSIVRAKTSTNPLELADLAKDKDPAIRKAVAGNSSTSAETLAVLADPKKTSGTDAETQTLVARNPKVSLDTLIELHHKGLSDDVKKVATTKLASWASTTDSSVDLSKLADLDDPRVNAALAGNNWATAEDLKPILTQVSKSKKIDAATQTELAKNDKTPVEVLRKLRASGLSEEVKTAALANLMERAKTSKDPKELQELVKDKKIADIRNALVVNPFTPPETLTELADPKKTPETDATTQQKIAKHPWAPAKLLHTLYQSGLSDDVKKAALAAMVDRAETGKWPSDLRYLVKVADITEIREGLAINMKTPTDVLRTLADPKMTPKTDAATQALIASNPSTPVDVLQNLKDSGLSDDIKKAAATALLGRATNSTDPGQLRHVGELSKDPAVLKALAANKAVPSDVLRDLADAKRTPATTAEIQGEILKNPSVSVEALQKLKDSGLSDDIKKAAAAALLDRAKTSGDVNELRQLAELSKDPDVRQAVAANPATPPEVLGRLADPKKTAGVDAALQQTIAANPHASVATVRALRDGGLSDDVKKAAAAALAERARASKDPAELRELLKDAKTPEVRRALAGNPGIPPDVLAALCDKTKVAGTDEATQTAALKNPAVTATALKELQKNGATEAIKKAAGEALADLAAAADLKTPLDKLRKLAEGSPSQEMTRALIANPSAPGELVAKMVVGDNRIAPDEILALRKRILDGKLPEAEVKKLLAGAGLSDSAAGQLAGWLTKGDEDFKRIFGLGGKFPVTVALKPGSGGLDIVAASHSDSTAKPESVEPRDSLDPLRAPASEVTISAPIEGKFEFDGGGKVESVSYTVTIRGKKVDVIFPKHGSTAGGLPTLDQVVKMLRLLPDAELDAIKRVAMNPERNPADEYWAVKYKDPKFYSGATGGHETINFFPGSNSESWYDSTVMHEGGHNLARKVKGSDGKDMDESTDWADAMARDGGSASSYADNSHAEDFAETVTLYLMGGRDDPAVRARFGHRFAVLDKIFAKGGK